MKKRIFSFLLALALIFSIQPIVTVSAEVHHPGTSSRDYVIPLPEDFVALNPTIYTYTADENSETVPFSSYVSQGKYSSASPSYTTDDEKKFRSTAYVFRLGDDFHVPAYSTMTFKGESSLAAGKIGLNGAQTLFVNCMNEWETDQTIKSLYLGQHSNRTGDYNQNKIDDNTTSLLLAQSDYLYGSYDNSGCSTSTGPDMYIITWATGNKPGSLNGKYSLYTCGNSQNEHNWAVISIKTVTNYIYYDFNGGSGSAQTTTKQGDESIAIAEAPTRTGYTFAGWNTAKNGSGKTYQPGAIYGENAGMYLYAQWIPNKYAVSIISDNCTTSVNQNPATYGTKVKITAEPDIGYQVDSIEVYKTADPTVTVSFAETNTFIQPEYPVTVKANCSKIPYAIDKYPTANGSFTVSDDMAGINDVVTITPIPDEGFELDTITVSRTDTNELLTVTDNKFTMVPSPVKVAVTFKNSIYNITKLPTTNGSFTIDQESTILGDTVVVNAVPDAGYRVKAISVHKTGDETVKVEVAGSSFVMPAYPVTVAVEFELTPLEIFKSSGIENGDITISHTQARLGETVTVSTTAAKGYTLDAITVYKTGDETVTVEVTDGSFVMPGYPVTVHATFKKIDYTVSVVDASNEKGSFTVDKTVAQIGDTVTVRVTCAEGWAVRGIILTDSSDNSTFVDSVFTMPADNVTVSVSYMVIPTYVITIPATVELGGAPMTLTITDAVMEEGVNLKVTLETDFTARTAEGAEKTFTINGGSVQNGDVVLMVEGGGTPLHPKQGSTQLSLEWDETYQYSGNYRATLAFTIRVEDEGYDQTE